MTEKMKIRGRLPVHERNTSRPPPTSIRIDGLVVKCLELTLADLQLLPQCELRDDFKCREGRMVPDLEWRGALLRTVLALASPLPEGRYVQASAGDFSLSLPLARADGVLLAISQNGTILSGEHGGPVRLVVPGGECFTSIKWLDHLELRSDPGLNTAETIALARLSSSGDSGRFGG